MNISLLMLNTCLFQSFDEDNSNYVVGSFNKDFEYGSDEPDAEFHTSDSEDQKPRILLMGLRRYCNFLSTLLSQNFKNIFDTIFFNV